MVQERLVELAKKVGVAEMIKQEDTMKDKDKMKRVDRQEDKIWILKTKVIPRLLDKSEIFGLRDEFLAALIQYVSACYNLIHLDTPLYIRIHLDKPIYTRIHLDKPL